MAFEDIESIVFRGDPSHVWLDAITEDDIVEYLGRKQPSDYHPDVIPLICRYPFKNEENIQFVCQRFFKLMLYSEKYLCDYENRTEVLVFIAGFLEAAGYTPALNQLIFHRNSFLKQGFDGASAEVLAISHAINNLYSRKFKLHST